MTAKLICPHCKKEMVKHIIKEGARYHVTSYHGSKNGALSHCSEPDCENNHGPGHCVSLKETPIPVCGSIAFNGIEKKRGLRKGKEEKR